MLIFDCETGPLPEEQLRELLPPFDESTVEGLVTGEFDPSSVKVGNLKDQAKIAEKIEQARAAHETAKANSGKIIADAKASHWTEFVARAALSAVTGRVLAIGYLATETDKFAVEHCDDNERQILSAFWVKYSARRAKHRTMAGHNIASFDVPFLARRSVILGVDVPSTLLPPPSRRYLDPIFADTMQLWGFGGREPIKLDLLGQVLGVGRKTEGFDAADFHKFWFGTPAERELAIEYLVQDLRVTAGVASRLCLA